MGQFTTMNGCPVGQVKKKVFRGQYNDNTGEQIITTECDYIGSGGKKKRVTKKKSTSTKKKTSTTKKRVTKKKTTTRK